MTFTRGANATTADEQSAVTGQAKALSYAIWLLLAAGTLKAVTEPFWSHANWTYFEQDDFFYYLKIAQNVATGHGSTFNGLTATNGYHPLWMLLLAAVLRVGVGTNGLLVFLATSIWVATMSVHWLAGRFLREAGVGLALRSVWAAFIAAYSVHVFVECMEVTLTVPLMFGLLVLVQNQRWWSQMGGAISMRGLVLGLVASAMILSRLDTAIFLALLLGCIAVQPTLRRSINQPLVLGFGVGLTPVLAYVATNRAIFGVWLPISGMAKELKLDHGFTGRVFVAISELSRMQRLNIVAVGIVLLALPWLLHRLEPIARALVLSTLLFPFVYFAVLSWTSDWRIWGWYYYCLRPALCVAVLVALRIPRIHRWSVSTPGLTLLVVLTLAKLAILTWDDQGSLIADAAWDVKGFADTHPGIYAMGDRSGAVGYLPKDPLVQTEGLVMDRRFLSYIADQVPLRDVLSTYMVRYYVGTAMVPFHGCFQAVEPWQGGIHTPHMRAEFCEQPVAQWVHAGIRTMVFDLAANRSISTR